MKKQTFLVLLGLICLVGGIVRLHKINSPIADWHSWRQADTAAVARNFLKFGIDPLRPRYDDISNIQSGKDNPQGWRMVEFPLYQLLSVGVYKLLPGVSIEIALRIVSILASMGSIILVGIIGKKISNSVVGLGSAFFLAVLPFSVFYGRAIFPEPLMVFLSLLSLTLALVFQKQGMLLLSASVAALALLVKPSAIFLLFPLPYLFLMRTGITWSGMLIHVISFLITIIPLFLWRQWIAQFPEGIPVFAWLFNEGNIRFKGAWFRWLFAERIGKLILGYWGLGILLLGLIRRKEWKEGLFFSLFLIGGLSYMIIIARGNVQHDYYQIPLLPIIALFLGKGFEWIIHPPKEFGTVATRIGGIITVGFIFAFSWYDIRGYYWINHPEIVEAGEEADRILPHDAKVIAPYNGDTTFLYHTNRQGWPLGFEIEKKIEQGATHYVTVSASDADGETKDLAQRYHVLVRNDRYAIIDLTRKK